MCLETPKLHDNQSYIEETNKRAEKKRKITDIRQYYNGIKEDRNRSRDERFRRKKNRSEGTETRQKQGRWQEIETTSRCNEMEGKKQTTEHRKKQTATEVWVSC